MKQSGFLQFLRMTKKRFQFFCEKVAKIFSLHRFLKEKQTPFPGSSRFILQHNKEYVIVRRAAAFFIKSTACFPDTGGVRDRWKQCKSAWCSGCCGPEHRPIWPDLFRFRKKHGRTNAAGCAETLCPVGRLPANKAISFLARCWCG